MFMRSHLDSLNTIKTFLFSVSILIGYITHLESATDLEPTALMKHETKWLVEALEKAHYSKVSIKNLDGKSFIDFYLEKLDKQKLYFINNDVEEFKKSYEATLVTFFEQGNLFPGFEIYNSYKQNSLERIDWAINYLDEFPNLESNRSYEPDRTDLDWATSEDILEDTWKNLITFEFLNETISQLDSNNTLRSFRIQTLRKHKKSPKEF